MDTKPHMTSRTQLGVYICPISVGENNSYGHPSGMALVSLLSNFNQPIVVTEKAGSVMVTHWLR